MTRARRDEMPPLWTRAALGLTCTAMALAGCGSPTVVNTGEPRATVETAPPAPDLPQHATNQHLADASAYLVVSGNPKVYRFETPSGRWQCEIVPHTSAGCSPAQAAPLSIAGAPTSVPGPDGEPAAPDTILIDRSSDVQFVDAPPRSAETEDTDAPVPTATLPFGTVLAVAGFRCNAQELTGVSCGSESSGKGFTFSDDGYTGVYTDVPQ